MTDRAQFEAMLEALINDDQAAAKEIFHNIVVGKSREIYEELLESDFQVEGENPFADDQGTPSAHKSKEEEEEGEEEEEEGEEEEGEEEGEEEEEEGEDGEDDGFGGEDDGEEGEGDIEDRVMDLEDALEDLKAEFEQLLAGEEHEEEENPGVHGDGMPMHDIEADMGDEKDPMSMMEYTIKVPSPKHGDDGVNKKSTVDNMKNDMGGTTANIAQNFSTTSGGTQGGLAKPTTEDLTKGLGDIQNRAGISKSKSFTKTVPEGHGAEKAGKKEQAVNDKSVIAKKVR